LEGVVPERVDLNRFADTRSDDPIANLRIHPSKLHARLAGVKEAVGIIDMDVVSRALQICADHLRQDGVELRDCVCVLSLVKVLPDRFEEPKCGVYGVVLRVSACVWKIVWEHAGINVARKRQQDFLSDICSSRCEREAGESNHGVAAPIAEPMI